MWMSNSMEPLMEFKHKIHSIPCPDTSAIPNELQEELTILNNQLDRAKERGNASLSDALSRAIELLEFEIQQGL